MTRVKKSRLIFAAAIFVVFGSLGGAQDAKPSGEITIWGWKAAMDPIVDSGVLADFEAEYPDVEVELVEYSPPDIYQQLPLAIASGVGAPDISFIASANLAQFVEFGGLTDLTERVQPYLDEISDFKWQDTMKDGRYYAMPWDTGPVVLYYRRDVFEAAGLPTEPAEVTERITSWEDYFEVCQSVKEATGSDCFAQNKANNYGDLYESMLWQQGLGFYNAQGEVTIDSPENVATLETLGQFWDAGLLSDQLEWSDGWYAELASLDEPVATLIMGAWMGVFLKTWIAPGTEGLWGVALMPSLDEGGARAANQGGSNFVILEQSDNKDAAWAFTEFVLGRPENQLRIFAASDIFPALETTYDAPLFSEPDPFFGGQVARETYTEVAQEVPEAYLYGPHYQEMHSTVATAIQKYATGGMSAEDALSEAADAIRRNTDLQ